MKEAFFISVDVEASGPAPSRYSLLSIGACSVENPEYGFYIELQPDGPEVDAAALAVGRLDINQLAAHGEPPATAMQLFADWVDETTPENRKPVCVGFNAPFDWMWIADYFHRYIGRNPFGHTALDMKALFMGHTGCKWTHTGFSHVSKHVGVDDALPHHALEDARLQALIFAGLLENLLD
ncbi:MAG: 3'-5' exonuclease [Rubricoccaceae bacterium]|nr:3'-5' exonuclease [Rubricoccaceae bacterium]